MITHDPATRAKGSRLTRVEVHLTHGTFDAARGEGRTPEWPPEPYRLFAALRAGAAGLRSTVGQDAEDRAVSALRRLETCPPPTIWASDATTRRHASFVPIIPDTRSAAKPPADVASFGLRVKANAYPEISTSRGLAFRAGVVPDAARVAFDIDTTGLDDDDLAWLAKAAAEVTYFGRSTSPAILTVAPVSAPPAHTVEYRPGRGPLLLGVWSPGLLTRLDEKHRALQADKPQHGRADAAYVSYERVGSRAPENWLAFEPQRDVPYRSLVRAAEELPRLIEETGAGVNVALIANVGAKHANGRLALGVTTEPDDERGAAIIRALRRRGWIPARSGRWLTRAHWTRSSQVFATATPLRLDTVHQAEAHTEIARRLRAWGDVEELAVTRDSFLLGAQDLRSRHHWHVAVKFSGTLPAATTPRRLGIFDGVLLPLDERRPRT